MKCYRKCHRLHSSKWIWKCRLQKAVILFGPHCINSFCLQRVRLSSLAGLMCWCTHCITVILPIVQNIDHCAVPRMETMRLHTWWRHQMETFSAFLAILCGEFTAHRWISRTKAGALMLSWICAWTNGWTNNGDACDLRRHWTHYDVIIMSYNFAGKPSMKWGRYCDSPCQTWT